MNEYFTWRRLGLLIRNDFVAQYRLFLNAFAVIAIIMMFNAIPAAGFGGLREELYFSIFAGMIIIWGSIHNSLMFSELTDKRLNEAYLLIPASALEKTLARYLNGTVFFVLHILVFTTVTALIIEGINLLLFGRYNDLFNPFDPGVWNVIGLFLAVQPVFFLGGAWFRRARWFKTVISIAIFCAALGLLQLLALLIFFAGSFDDLYLLFNGGLQDLDVNIKLFTGSVIVLKILWYGIVPPFCWYVTWLRVRETQVSYGI
jgi:hypothetical protein